MSGVESISRMKYIGSVRLRIRALNRYVPGVRMADAGM